MRVLLKLSLVVAALVSVAPDADAHGYRRSGTSVFLGFNYWGAPYPYYPYYPRYYYAPAPSVVFVERPGTIQPSIQLGPEIGQGCREYRAPMTVGGQVVEGYGTACPRADGSWQIVN